jgi:hypothetical protein
MENKRYITKRCILKVKNKPTDPQKNATFVFINNAIDDDFKWLKVV